MIPLLNETLKEENNKKILDYKDESYPLYFIISQPRGASSLLQQLLLSNLEIGYINNFLAKFYKCPIFGLELEKGIIDKNYKSNFISNYGNTEGINEPHEWGWFWKNQLKLEKEEYISPLTDFTILKRNLLAITNTRKLPLIIDNAFAISNLLKIKKQFKNIKIINLTRDLYFVSNSFINASLKRYGDINVLYGNSPLNTKIDNPIEQIVYRVKSIQNEIDDVVKYFEDQDVLHIDYEEIYNNSFDVVQKFHSFVQLDNINLSYKEKHLPFLTYRNDKKLINDKYKDDLDVYYKKYFGINND